MTIAICAYPTLSESLLSKPIAINNHCININLFTLAQIAANYLLRYDHLRHVAQMVVLKFKKTSCATISTNTQCILDPLPPLRRLFKAFMD